MPIVSDSIQRGIPRVEGTEVTVLQIHRAIEEHCIDPKTVAEAHGITMDEVLAWAHNHPDEIAEARETEAALRREMVDDRADTQPRD